MEYQKTVLVVDDQKQTRYIIEQMFNELGYECLLAKSGEEALTIIDQTPSINLLLSDINMQGIDGLDVLQTCKAINPKLPVVIMSGCSKDETILEALRNGASDYLIKPFKIVHLKSVVTRVEELYHNRDQIITNRNLIRSMELNFEIPSGKLEVDKIQAILKNTLQIYSEISNKELLNLSLIIEESILNAHEHGNLELVSGWKEDFIDSSSETRFDLAKKERLENPRYADKVIKIQLMICPEKISISIEDEGKGYPMSVIGSDATGKPFGMGLMLIKNLSDNLFFNETGTKITIEKYITKEKNENPNS